MILSDFNFLKVKPIILNLWRINAVWTFLLYMNGGGCMSYSHSQLISLTCTLILLNKIVIQNFYVLFVFKLKACIFTVKTNHYTSSYYCGL